MENINTNKEVGELEQKVSHLSKMLVKSFGYADEDPDTFLQNARKTTEAICKFIYVKEIGELKNKKMMLNDLSRALTTQKVIPNKIAILIGTIQTYGNYGSHAQDDFSETTREWIAPCQTALANLTNWFFLEYLDGNVPQELLNPINDYTEEKIVTQSTTRRKKGSESKTKKLGLVGGLIIIIIIGFIYFNSKEEKEIKPVVNIKKSIIPTQSVEKQTKQVIEKVNEQTKNVNAKRIAILYFDNSSEDKKLNQLKKGLADMLISDLSKVSMLNVVERAKLEEILKEQKLNNTSNFDAKTASKIGKLLGVEHIMTGSFFELMGRLRIDARLLDVETGKILKSEGVDGDINRFFDLEKKLVTKLVKGFDVEVTEEEQKSIDNKGGDISYKNSLFFSKTLDLIDKGENKKAIENLEKLLKESPEFLPAQKELNKLKVEI